MSSSLDRTSEEEEKKGRRLSRTRRRRRGVDNKQVIWDLRPTEQDRPTDRVVTGSRMLPADLSIPRRQGEAENPISSVKFREDEGVTASQQQRGQHL